MEKTKIISLISQSGFFIAVLSVIFVLLASFLSRFHLVYYRTGLKILEASVLIGTIGLIISLVCTISAAISSDNKSLIYSVSGLILCLVVLAIPLYMVQLAKKVPMIHDITTDTDNPPGFVSILPLRENAENSPEYGGAEIAAKQKKAYPDIQPLQINIPPVQAMAKANDIALQMGWEIMAEDPVQGRIEATDTTFWMGFKDDIIIRIAKQESGSRVDVRSVSRVGKSDIGANAKRIRMFLAKMSK